MTQFRASAFFQSARPKVTAYGAARTVVLTEVLSVALVAFLALFFGSRAGTAEELSLKGLFIGDAWANVGSGGKAKGERYLSNMLVSADLPLPDGSEEGNRSRIHVSALHNTGQLFSGDLVGDTQLVSNIEARRASRVFEAYYEYQSESGRSSWLLGLWDLNREIDVIDPAGLFINSSQGIGAEFGTSGRNGPSIFPITSLALRTRQIINDRLTVRAAILDGVPGNPNAPDRPRARLELADKDGALLVGEAEYIFENQWTGKLGAWHYTTRREILQSEVAATSLSQDEETGPAQGIYASLSGTLLNATDARGKLEAFARVGLANEEVQKIGSYAGAGLVWSEFADTLVDEKVGFAVAHAGARRAARRLGDDSYETALEFTFSTQMTPWLRLQPNLQYVINPGFDKAVDDTLVLGLRFELTGGVSL